MQVLWLSHRDPLHPRAGGAERTLMEVTKRLAARGHGVEILSGAWQGGSPHQKIDGVSVTRVRGLLKLHARALLAQHSMTSDTVVVEDLAHVIPWGVTALSSTPTVAFFRHLHRRTLQGQVPFPLDVGLASVERLYPALYRKVQVVTESNTSVRDMLNLGMRQESIHRIPPGVDLDLFKTGVRHATPLLIYFGGYRAYKRPIEALSLAASLRSHGFKFRLVFVGSGPALAEIRRRISDLHLEHEVVVAGRLSDEDLSAILQQAWLNLHFSLAEGWCLSALEAAACGVPTVAYAVPGIVDSIQDGETGILVPNGDRQAITAAVIRILDDPKSWAARCRSYAEAFTWNRCAKGWEGVLSSALLAGRAKRQLWTDGKSTTRAH
jgi:glycosyltransferase involved in cell wall biosynthesis